MGANATGKTSLGKALLRIFAYCVSKLKDFTADATKKVSSLKEMIGDIQYRFAYPEIEKQLKLTAKKIKIFC